MTDDERKNTMADTLEVLIQELRKGAAGPCHYWYEQLAKRLAERVRNLR